MVRCGELQRGGRGGRGVRGDSANGSIMGDVEAEARRTLELDASAEESGAGKSRVDSTVVVKPFTETLHPSPKQVVPIAVDSYSGAMPPDLSSANAGFPTRRARRDSYYSLRADGER